MIICDIGCSGKKNHTINYFRKVGKSNEQIKNNYNIGIFFFYGFIGDFGGSCTVNGWV